MRHVFNATMGTVQRQKLGDREYFVAPLTSIVEGVLNGSRGALFYPNSEIRNSTPAWDDIPIVVYHPVGPNGVHVSAFEPGILERQGIGFLRSSKFNGKLQHEAWVDVNRVMQVDKRVHDALASGQPMEVSTGLHTEDEPKMGMYNGKPYTHIARNYRPDHMAILPDQIGACSLNDGCGLGVNTLTNNPAVSEAQRRYLNAQFGHDWVKEHGFDNRGPLPDKKKEKEKVKSNVLMRALSFIGNYLTVPPQGAARPQRGPAGLFAATPGDPDDESDSAAAEEAEKRGIKTKKKAPGANAHEERCPECGGKIVDDECEDCGYVENSIGRGNWSQPSRSAHAEEMSKVAECPDSHSAAADAHEAAAKEAADARATGAESDYILAGHHSFKAKWHREQAKLTENVWSDSAREAALKARGASVMAASRTAEAGAVSKASDDAFDRSKGSDHKVVAADHRDAAKELRSAGHSDAADAHEAAAKAHETAMKPGVMRKVALNREENDVTNNGGTHALSGVDREQQKAAFAHMDSGSESGQAKAATAKAKERGTDEAHRAAGAAHKAAHEYHKAQGNDKEAAEHKAAWGSHMKAARKAPMESEVAQNSRREMLTALAANCECANDVRNLSLLSDATLRRLTVNAPNFSDAKPDAKTEAEMKKRKKVEEDADEADEAEEYTDNTEAWLKRQPKAVRAVFNSALIANNDRKKQLVAQLTTNVMDAGQKVRLTMNLMEKDVSDLEDLVALVPQTRNSEVRMPFFIPPEVANAASDSKDILETPTMNFNEKAGAA